MKKILSLLFTFTTIVVSAQIYNPVSWKFSQKQISDSEVELQFKAEIEEHWHMYSQYVDDEMIATKFTFFYNGDTIVSKPAEGRSIKQYDPIFEITLRYFEDKAVFKQKIIVNSSNSVMLGGYIDFIVCDESSCLLPPSSKFLFTIKGVGEVVEEKDALTFTQKN